MDKNPKIIKLERQIKELEKKLSAGSFNALVDRKARKRDEDRLKKLSKELEELTKPKKKAKPKTTPKAKAKLKTKTKTKTKNK